MMLIKLFTCRFAYIFFNWTFFENDRLIGRGDFCYKGFPCRGSFMNGKERWLKYVINSVEGSTINKPEL